jgi:hypothetical protein
MHKVLLILTVIMLVSFVSCSKTGPAGPAGKDGTNGTNGTNGADGNANVLVDTLTITSTQWKVSDDIIYSDSTESTLTEDKTFDIQFPAITQGVIDSGLVAVYFAPDNSSTDMEPLPFQFLYDENLLEYDYKVELGVVHLFIYYARLSNVYPDIANYYPGSHTFKVVAMSGHL